VKNKYGKENKVKDFPIEMAVTLVQIKSDTIGFEHSKEFYEGNKDFS
jgi:hypothetical protein